MENQPTPRVKMLLDKLNFLTLDLQKDMNRLVCRLDANPTLVNAPRNTKTEKERHKKSYAVTLKEIVDSGLEYEQLQSI